MSMKMCTCNVLSGSKLLVIAAVVAAHVGVCAETNIPVPATYIMVCCHGADKGTKFLANGEWDAKHNYGDYDFALDQMRKIKAAGINVVGVDFTNPSQWDQFKAHHWPMLQNVVRAAKELDMQYFLFLGNTCAHTMKYWNEKAKIVWEEFAQDPHYRRYGFGDDRPMMTIFLPGKDFAAHLKRSKPEEKNWLEKFRIGTCQVNDPIVPTPTDGWGYRNKSAGSTDLARFAAPNSGVGPKEWARVDANEWRSRVKWALGAKEYAVIGTYDDTCDCIFWGIADVRGSRNPIHVHESTKNDPYAYYNVVKEEIAKRRAGSLRQTNASGRSLPRINRLRHALDSAAYRARIVGLREESDVSRTGVDHVLRETVPALHVVDSHEVVCAPFRRRQVVAVEQDDWNLLRLENREHLLRRLVRTGDEVHRLQQHADRPPRGVCFGDGERPTSPVVRLRRGDVAE